MDNSVCQPNEILTDFGCVPNDPVGFVSRFYSIGLGLIGMVGLLFLIIGAYFILTSRGDPSMLQKGKSYILYSIIGIMLAIFGFVFIQVIAGDILKIPGFTS